MGLGKSKAVEETEVKVATHEKRFDGTFTTKKAEERQKEIERLRRERLKEIERMNKQIFENQPIRNFFTHAKEQELSPEPGKKGKVKKDAKSKDKKDKKSTTKKDKSSKKTDKDKKDAKSKDKKEGKEKKDSKKDKDASTDKKKDDKKKDKDKKDEKEKKDKKKEGKEDKTTTRKGNKKEEDASKSPSPGKKLKQKVDFKLPKKDGDSEEFDDEAGDRPMVKGLGKSDEEDDINIPKWNPKFTKEQENCNLWLSRLQKVRKPITVSKKFQRRKGFC